MSMYDAISHFNEQFSYEPEIKNAGKLGNYETYVIAGMGGSHLAADLLKVWNPGQNIMIHRGYDLPPLAPTTMHIGVSPATAGQGLAPKEVTSRLIILSSHSGNTEETLSAYDKAKEMGEHIAVITTGGELLSRAEHDGVPFIILPSTGIQPRSALGFGFRALLAMLRAKEALAETKELVHGLSPAREEKSGKALAEKLSGYIPVIYASLANEPLAYNWKIKFNETGKIPAFYNVLPELNHNEMTGFDVAESTRELSKKFHFVFLKDPVDDPRIQKRMRILETLFRARGLPVSISVCRGKTVFHRMFSSLIEADWAAYYTAEKYGVEPEQVPMVEEFKALMKQNES